MLPRAGHARPEAAIAPRPARPATVGVSAVVGVPAVLVAGVPPAHPAPPRRGYWLPVVLARRSSAYRDVVARPDGVARCSGRVGCRRQVRESGRAWQPSRAADAYSGGIRWSR